MTNYVGRQVDLKNKINKHLKKLTGHDSDFYSLLAQDDLMELKRVLADINNLLTFQMTIAAANWISRYFEFDEIDKLSLLKKIDNTKPNTKGFDIFLMEPYQIMCEVKCIAPVNNGGTYGVAQHDSIMNDVHKLIHGKGGYSDTSKFYKFLFLIDLGERTDQAVIQLIKQTKGKTLIANKFNILKEKSVSLLENGTEVGNLDFKTVYIKKIRIEQSSTVMI